MSVSIGRQGVDEHRFQVLRKMFNGREPGLEIGPSFRPIAPKAGGFNIETVDHASAGELREKYRDKPTVLVDQIEEVDFIWRGGSLVDLIGARQKYNYILASHVIEHTTDIIRFLQDCEALLKPNGFLILAVPDKRYCFDFFRPVSTLGDAIQAYVEHRDRHSVATVFDHYSLLARNGVGSWDKDKLPDNISFIFSPGAGLREANRAQETDEYMDAHAWQFTPSSFRLLLADMAQLGLCNLSEDAIVDGRSCEFFVCLKNARGEVPDRLTLAKEMLKEQLAALP